MISKYDGHRYEVYAPAFHGGKFLGSADTMREAAKISQYCKSYRCDCSGNTIHDTQGKRSNQEIHEWLYDHGHST